MILRRLHTVSILLGVGLISGCAPPPKVAVEERSVLTARQESEKLGGQIIRIVEPGDTLYSIAFVSGLDVNRVAAWNGIRDTSRLEVGQRIRLTAPLGFKYQPPVSSTVTGNSAKPATNNRVKQSPAVVKTTTPTAKPPSAQPSVTNKPPANSAPRSRKFAAPVWTGTRWWWPTKGAVIGRFELASGRQGIDIKAAAGQPVIAAGDGEVVYVGNSLKGYGNLIIIKHNEQFLSAYAHNQNIYVKEGDMVKARGRIGAVGLNNRRQNALHFQIRKNGKPVNPLNYLPKI